MNRGTSAAAPIMPKPAAILGDESRPIPMGMGFPGTWALEKAIILMRKVMPTSSSEPTIERMMETKINPRPECTLRQAARLPPGVLLS